MEEKVACPRCLQGWLELITLTAFNEQVVFCPECNAMWHCIGNIASNTFVDYNTYLLDRGRIEPGDPKEIEFVRHILKSELCKRD